MMRIVRRVDRRLRWIGQLAAIVLLASCTTNPATQEKEFTLVTEAQEIELGRAAHGEVIEQFGQYPDSGLEQYVAGVGEKLTSVSHRKDLPYRFTVLDSPIVNAFALPGGGLYVTRGLIANLNSEAELAGVLGHEVGHVAARHGAQAATRVVSYQVITGLLSALDERLANLKPLSDTTAGLMFLKYGRDAEYQADELGTQYAYEATYDPRWLGTFLRSLAALEEARPAPPEFLSTHPSTPERVARVDALAEKLTAQGSSGLQVGSSRYKKRLEGLIYGPGPKGWVWSGGRLANQAHRIALQPPEDWDLQTEHLAFSIRNSRVSSAEAEWRIHENVQTTRVSVFVQQIEKRLKLKSSDRSTFRLGPLEGLKARYLGSSQGTDAALIIYYALDGRAGYTFAAIAPASSQEQMEAVYDQLAQSLVKLKTGGAQALPIQRVHLKTARTGEQLEQLVRRVYGDTEHLKAIALLNGLSHDATLTGGTFIKVILPSPTLRRSK